MLLLVTVATVFFGHDSIHSKTPPKADEIGMFHDKDTKQIQTMSMIGVPIVRFLLVT